MAAYRWKREEEIDKQLSVSFLSRRFLTPRFCYPILASLPSFNLPLCISLQNIVHMNSICLRKETSVGDEEGRRKVTDKWPGLGDDLLFAILIWPPRGCTSYCFRHPVIRNEIFSRISNFGSFRSGDRGAIAYERTGD